MPGISKGATLFRNEYWSESQGSGSWSCSALNLLFDLGLSIPLPETQFPHLYRDERGFQIPIVSLILKVV